VKTTGGFLHGGKKYPVTDLMRGLIVEVEGRGDAQGELVAERSDSGIRHASSRDFRYARGPLEENQKKIAGQIDELYAVPRRSPTSRGSMSGFRRSTITTCGNRGCDFSRQ
jgi:hypothetical protein